MTADDLLSLASGLGLKIRLSPDGELRLHAECSLYPGRVLAAEWLDTTHGRHEWVRFLTKFG
jgi:hypothetical protein